MSGYIDAGYVIVLGTLGVYGTTLLARERAARRRAGQPPDVVAPPQPGEGDEP